jgi:hypothetical protein
VKNAAGGNTFILEEDKMRRLLIAVMVVALSLALSSTALAFRCGTRLISIGNTKAEVLQRCGEPDWRESWQEDRVERVFAPSYFYGDKFKETRVPVAVVRQVIIEEWTYNLGPTQFQRTLLFENNKLIEMQTGSYGY